MVSIFNCLIKFIFVFQVLARVVIFDCRVCNVGLDLNQWSVTFEEPGTDSWNNIETTADMLCEPLSMKQTPRRSKLMEAEASLILDRAWAWIIGTACL